ncbi:MULTISPECIES: hypothetical protein [unclassified Pseudomonas]|uniref:hypothetical protein n=1 Tax=unclassified Pseudomonas TaxID=196821 RepID=UPI00211525BA|nr:hypothetical protein [Pseudomonas sp. MN1F]
MPKIKLLHHVWCHFALPGRRDVVSEKLGQGLVIIGIDLVPGSHCLGAQQQVVSARHDPVHVVASLVDGVVGATHSA